MSKATGESHIPTPFAQRVRLLRRRAVPAIVWLCAILALIVWSRGRARFIEGVGLVQAQQVTVSPLADGTVGSLAVDLFDEIVQGQVLAVMDDSVVRAELMIAEAEMTRLRSAVVAESRRLEAELSRDEADALNDLRRFRMNEEEARLQYLEMVVRQESDTVKLERLRLQMVRQRDLAAQFVDDQERYDETRLRYEALKKQLEENEAAIVAAKDLFDQAAQRRAEWEGQVVETGTTDFLEPIRQALTVQEARIRQISQRRARLALIAPIGGQVMHIYRRPGETVLAGDPVLALTDTEAQRVLAYVDERYAGAVQPGNEVRLQSEHRSERIVVARVARTGSALEELPIALRKTPFLPQWGFPVLIDDLPQGVFLPGERLKIWLNAATQVSVPAPEPAR